MPATPGGAGKPGRRRPAAGRSPVPLERGGAREEGGAGGGDGGHGVWWVY